MVHVGEVRLAGEKMAKSTGNLVLIGDVLRSHSAPAVRLALLNRTWHEPWECADSEFDDAAALLEELHAAAGRPGDVPGARDRVLQLLVTDLNVPAAVALALEEGAGAARFLIEVLKLREDPTP